MGQSSVSTNSLAELCCPDVVPQYEANTIFTKMNGRHNTQCCKSAIRLSKNPQKDTGANGQSMRTRTRRSIKTNIRMPMQQLDHVSEMRLAAKPLWLLIKGPHTLIVFDDPTESLHAVLQFASHSIGELVRIVQHLSLLFELSTHLVCLLS